VRVEHPPLELAGVKTGKGSHRVGVEGIVLPEKSIAAVEGATGKRADTVDPVCAIGEIRWPHKMPSLYARW
jgi:hypothetical protein